MALNAQVWELEVVFHSWRCIFMEVSADMMRAVVQEQYVTFDRVSSSVQVHGNNPEPVRKLLIDALAHLRGDAKGASPSATQASIISSGEVSVTINPAVDAAISGCASSSAVDSAPLSTAAAAAAAAEAPPEFLDDFSESELLAACELEDMKNKRARYEELPHGQDSLRQPEQEQQQQQQPQPSKRLPEMSLDTVVTHAGSSLEEAQDSQLQGTPPVIGGTFESEIAKLSNSGASVEPSPSSVTPIAVCRPNMTACLAWALLTLKMRIETATAEMHAGVEAQRIWKTFRREVTEWDAKLAD
jgi:hypothetical protein